MKHQLNIDSRYHLFWKVPVYMYITCGICCIGILVLLIYNVDTLINSVVKQRIERAFVERYPAYTLQISTIKASYSAGVVRCDSITIVSRDSSVKISVASSSIKGIHFTSLLSNYDDLQSVVSDIVIETGAVVVTLQKSRYTLKCTRLVISNADSNAIVENIAYQPYISDEEFFTKQVYRQSRYLLQVPDMHIRGVSFYSLFTNNQFYARSVTLKDVKLDVLVNTYKPNNPKEQKPLMPMQALGLISQKFKIDSLVIDMIYSKYSEQVHKNTTPALIPFYKVHALITGINNARTTNSLLTIKTYGYLFGNGKVSVNVQIPRDSPGSTFKYSGTIGRVDLKQLNSYLRIAENRRLTSGVFIGATFSVAVGKGIARGKSRFLYKDVYITILDAKTKSSAGVVNSIRTFLVNLFTIHGTNLPDTSGKVTNGIVKYTQKRTDSFFQLIWFSFRSGVENIIGF